MEENKNNSEQFVRKSYKFLIPINNIAKVSEILNLNFDVVKFSISDTAHTHTYIQKVSSTYFDNDSYDSYNTRLMKNPDSICIRFRTYNDDNEKIFAECKTRKGYTIENSTKERIQISLDEYNDLTSSRESYSESSPLILDKINYFIIGRNYKEKLKIIYNRIAYTKDDIRITFDTDLIGYSISDSDNIFRLKYGVLELKIISGQSYMDIPYIDTLIKSKIILEIPEFSKFLTVSYYLFANNLNNKPYYYDDIIDSIVEPSIKDNILSKPINNQKTCFPIALKPNTFTSIESLYYKIFNIIIAVPFTLSNYDKLTNHQSLLLNPIILKYYLIISLGLNLATYIKINHDLIDRTLNHMGTIFPLLLAMITILSIIF
jgi:SPX domain protein involved in polyphosphate accumulation